MENKSPELGDEFIKYLGVTKFKTTRISAEIDAAFTKSWSSEVCFFLVGSFEINSFKGGSFASFPF